MSDHMTLAAELVRNRPHDGSDLDLLMSDAGVTLRQFHDKLAAKDAELAALRAANERLTAERDALSKQVFTQDVELYLERHNVASMRDEITVITAERDQLAATVGRLREALERLATGNVSSSVVRAIASAALADDAEGRP